jgi:hypothetical protein
MSQGTHPSAGVLSIIFPCHVAGLHTYFYTPACILLYLLLNGQKLQNFTPLPILFCGLRCNSVFSLRISKDVAKVNTVLKIILITEKYRSYISFTSEEALSISVFED